VSVCGYQSVALKGSSSALSGTREQAEELRDEKKEDFPAACLLQVKDKNEKSIANADTATEMAV